MGGKNHRNSSIELFRILATFLVLIVHLNGWMAGDLVDWNDVNITSFHKVSQLIIQSLCVVCVNSFLIITGWYGLKLRFASIWKIWVLLFSIYVPFYLFSCIFGNIDFSILSFSKQVLAFPCENYFVQNYLMLLFISPVLNSFIESYRERLTIFAITLFFIEVVMESIFQNKCLHIEYGYSLFHFVTMYFLARTAFMHQNKILAVKKYYWIIGYFTCAIFVCILHFTPYKYNWAYSNPVVIIQSFMLFFPFVYGSSYNKFINWMAQGSLAVYIIQVTNPVCDNLFSLDKYALNNFDYPVYLFFMLIFSIIFFAICLIYKEIMQKVLNLIFKPIEKFIETHIFKYI